MERLTPHETGVILISLLVFVIIAGAITDLIEAKKIHKLSELPAIPTAKRAKFTDTRMAFRLGDRIVIINKCVSLPKTPTIVHLYDEVSYKYTIMDLSYNILRSDTIHNLSESIIEFSDSICNYMKYLSFNPNIRGNINEDDTPIYLVYDDVKRHMRE